MTEITTGDGCGLNAVAESCIPGTFTASSCVCRNNTVIFNPNTRMCEGMYSN